MTLARHARPLALGLWRIARWMAAHRPESFLGEFEKELSGRDREVFSDSRIRHVVLATFREALRAGAAGVVDDSAIQAAAWGFDLEDIPGRVELWHGDCDALVPLHHPRHAVRMISDARLTVLEGEGHLALASHGAEVAAALSRDPV